MSDSFRPSRVPSSGSVAVALALLVQLGGLIAQWVRYDEFRLNALDQIKTLQNEVSTLKGNRSEDSKTAAVLSTEFGAIKTTLAELRSDVKALGARRERQ